MPKHVTTVSDIVGIASPTYTYPEIKVREKTELVHDESCYVGVELEMEGAEPFFQLHEACDHYLIKVTEDNSLKYKGVELLFASPLAGIDIIKGLDNMQRIIDLCDNRYTAGDRGSTHLHFNVLNLTCDELTRFVMLSYVVEPYLYSLAPPHRSSNVFCIPMHRLRDFNPILKSITRQSYNFSTDFYKYRGIALNSIRVLGTLEFRMFDSCLHTQRILEWINIIQRIKSLAKSLPDTFFDEIHRVDIDDILRFIAEKPVNITGTDIRRHMWENLRAIGWFVSSDKASAKAKKQNINKAKATFDALVSGTSTSSFNVSEYGFTASNTPFLNQVIVDDLEVTETTDTPTEET
jgi:hypothetical protein